mgnify:CR=1 FL=1
MYALTFGFSNAGNSVVSSRHVDFEQHPAASAQKAVKLRGARVVRHRFDNPQPSRATQGDADVVGKESMQRRRLRQNLERPAGVGGYSR